jgi:type VI secretion system protein
MTGRGLLDRLGKPAKRSTVLESIVAHLRVLLNSRTGTSLTAPDYGVIDFNDIVHNLPDGVRYIQASLRETIQNHEPRLTNVNIRHLKTDDSLLLRFEITARLAGDPLNVLRLHCRLYPGGMFAIGS